MEDYFINFSNLDPREVEKNFLKNDIFGTGKITFFSFMRTIVPYEYEVDDKTLEEIIRSRLQVDPYTFEKI